MAFETDSGQSDTSSFVSLGVTVTSAAQNAVLRSSRQVSSQPVFAQSPMILARTANVSSGLCKIMSHPTTVDGDSPATSRNTTRWPNTLRHTDSELSEVVQQDFEQSGEPDADVEGQLTELLPVQFARDRDVPGVDELRDEVQLEEHKGIQEFTIKPQFKNQFIQPSVVGTKPTRPPTPRDDFEAIERVFTRQAARIERLCSELGQLAKSETSNLSAPPRDPSCGTPTHNMLVLDTVATIPHMRLADASSQPVSRHLNLLRNTFPRNHPNPDLSNEQGSSVTSVETEQDFKPSTRFRSSRLRTIEHASVEEMLNHVKLQKLIAEAVLILAELAKTITPIKQDPQPQGQQQTEESKTSTYTTPGFESRRECEPEPEPA
jgi:hypothetical protein